MADSPQFIGVYSIPGSATSAKKKKELFFVWQQYQKNGAVFFLQEIDAAFTPCGKLRRADKSTIDLFFRFEPNILAQPISQPDFTALDEPRGKDRPGLFPPEQKKEQKKEQKTEKKAEQKEPAQKEAGKPQPPVSPPAEAGKPVQKAPAAAPQPTGAPDQKAARKDTQKDDGRPKPVVTGPRGPVTSENFVARAQEKMLRNNFAEAFQKLHEPSERTRALKAIKKIADHENGIVPEHKHMFRDFSVSMRKEDLPEIALKFATRSVDLAPNDDHAHFNLARIFVILTRYDDAIKEIHKALQLPISEDDGNLYKQLLRYVEREKARHREELRQQFS